VDVAWGSNLAWRNRDLMEATSLFFLTSHCSCVDVLYL
jgi:hypothetical protein